jgi:hypothetical protein
VAASLPRLLRAGLLKMLDDAVRAREHKTGVAVVETYEKRGSASSSVHLDDLARVLCLAYYLAVYVQSVTDRCLHGTHLLVSACTAVICCAVS